MNDPTADDSQSDDAAQGPSQSASPDAAQDDARNQRSGFTICTNFYEDGTRDVYSKPLEQATEQQYPDGIFGLKSDEDTLKAVFSMMQHGPDFQKQEDDAMMGEYNKGQESPNAAA